MDRLSIMRSFINKSEFGLEIGPSYNPVAPKSEGYNVETLDYCSADELRNKYKENGKIDISRIEEVDYISKGERISAIIQNKHYDYIIASHVIEHIPDIIGFFHDCASLLTPHGTLILAVPDKRYCFDVYKPLSSAGDLVQAHFEKRTRHTVGKMFDNFAYTAYHDGQLAWSKEIFPNLSLVNNIKDAQHVITSYIQSEAYHDIHGWHFTPESFRLIINDLNEAGYISLKEKDFIDTIGCEFIVALSQSGPGCPLSRQSLLDSIIGGEKNTTVEVNGGNLAKDTYKISVVIPVFNGERYLHSAILSAATQSLPPYEIIVVDDGSTDNSAALIKELSDTYPITFYQKENGGQSSARNFGVRVSSGDLIAFLDQDDLWYPNHLEELIKPFFAGHNPETGWVYSDMDEIGSNGELLIMNVLNYFPENHPKRSLVQCLQADMFVLPSASLILRKAFDEVGGFDERLSGYEDDDLFVRLFAKGYGNIFIKKSLSQWRMHEESSSRTQRMAVSRMIYAKKLFETFPDNPLRLVKYSEILWIRFARVIFEEYRRAIMTMNTDLAVQSMNNLHELIEYMESRKIPYNKDDIVNLFFGFIMQEYKKAVAFRNNELINVLVSDLHRFYDHMSTKSKILNQCVLLSQKSATLKAVSAPLRKIYHLFR